MPPTEGRGRGRVGFLCIASGSDENVVFIQGEISVNHDAC